MALHTTDLQGLDHFLIVEVDPVTKLGSAAQALTV